MDDIISEFLVESHDNLEQVDNALVSLEEDPENLELLNGIFRTVHTIKGTCGFLDFNKLESVTHKGENLLDKLRNGELQLSEEIIDGLLAMVDAVREMLGSIESSREEGDTDYLVLIDRLIGLSSGAEAATPAEAAAAAPAEVEEAAPEAPSEEQEAPLFQVQANAEIAGTAAAAAAESAPPPAKPEAAGSARPRSSRGSVADGSIRVSVGLLDKLMNLVGELVLARNQVLELTEGSEDSELLATSQRLNRITSELQEGIMKTRMQPVGSVWNRFPRVVRDLARACGKQIALEMEGKETEIDKSLIEAIKDPLTHIIRNSVDHGIETPEVRVAAGKPAEGVIQLRAFHEGGQVNIEIIDDGAGINVERVKAKAVERGLYSEEQVEKLSEREIVALVMEPGFSTARKVTHVSGRGVGMDVVRTHIEKIGGTVDLESTPGEGTTLKIKIPLTLAIIPALVVTSGGNRFAIPQVNLVELVHLDGERAIQGIEAIHGAPVYRLRGRLRSLVYLNKELQLEENPGAGGDGGEVRDGRDVLNIVVLHADQRYFGLVVDEINDTQEIVVKPLGKPLSVLNCYAGATIMGDGRVALILDVLGVAHRAHVITEGQSPAPAQGMEREAAVDGEKQALLIFKTAADGRMAIPSELVSRLEEIDRSIVEVAGGNEVVQYRGGIMPLMRLSSLLPEPRSSFRNEEASEESEKLQVVVFSRGERTIGIVVEKILDIVNEDLVLHDEARRDGVLGTTVIQGRVTEILDIERAILAADPRFFEEEEQELLEVV